MGDKLEMKTYALGISTGECYSAMFNDEMERVLDRICHLKEFVGVHPTPRIQIFLYMTPDARRRAYKIARDNGFKSAMTIEKPAFVPLSDVPLAEVDHGTDD